LRFRPRYGALWYPSLCGPGWVARPESSTGVKMGKSPSAQLARWHLQFTDSLPRRVCVPWMISPPYREVVAYHNRGVALRASPGNEKSLVIPTLKGLSPALSPNRRGKYPQEQPAFIPILGVPRSEDRLHCPCKFCTHTHTHAMLTGPEHSGMAMMRISPTLWNGPFWDCLHKEPSHDRPCIPPIVCVTFEKK
jgi:hypothetical protein